MMKAASSAEPGLTTLSPVSAAAAPVSPKPPRMTLTNERFIAWHMI
jgi:hypothetical protein